MNSRTPQGVREDSEVAESASKQNMADTEPNQNNQQSNDQSSFANGTAKQQQTSSAPYSDARNEREAKSGNENSPYSEAQQQPSQAFQPNINDARALRSAQSKITFAYIVGPLSLFIGGMLLGVIGLICAGLAYKKLGELEGKEQSIAQQARKLKKTAKTALIICVVAFVLNGISMYLMYPIIMEMLQSGQYGEIAGSLGAGTSAGTSAWG